MHETKEAGKDYWFFQINKYYSDAAALKAKYTTPQTSMVLSQIFLHCKAIKLWSCSRGTGRNLTSIIYSVRYLFSQSCVIASKCCINYYKTGGPLTPGCKKWHVAPLKQPRFETKWRQTGGAPRPLPLPRPRPRGIPRPLPRMLIGSVISPSSSSFPYSPPSSNWSAEKSSRLAW